MANRPATGLSGGEPGLSHPQDPLNLRLLVLSRMYPRPGFPSSGIFIEHWARAIADHVRSLEVISPQVYVPPLLRRMPRYAHYQTPLFEQRRGLNVHRPVYPRPPGAWFGTLEPGFLVRSIRPVARRLLRDQPADILLAVNLIPDGAAAVRLGRELGLKVVVNVIGSDVTLLARQSPRSRRLAQGVCRGADLLLCQSQELCQEVLAMGATPERAIRYWRGLDTRIFDDLPDKADCRRLWNLASDDQTLIVFVGRISHRKGAFDLLEAVAGLGSRGASRLRLGMIGEPAELQALRERSAQLGLADRITVTGLLEHAQVLRRVKGADLLVLPSHTEGLPNSVLEAFAAGVPVAASLVGGLREIAQLGDVFYPFESGDVAGLTRCLRSALGNPQQTAAKAQAARELIHEHLDLSRNTAWLVQRLMSLVHQSNQVNQPHAR